MAIKGFVDTIDEHLIVGWAVDVMETDIPVALDVLQNGSVVDRIVANAHRADVQQAGYGLGRHGFFYKPPRGIDGRTLQFRSVGSPTALPLSQLATKVDGRLEIVTKGQATGWALNLDRPATSIELELLIDDVVVSRRSTGGLRPDVAVKFPNAGAAGFVFTSSAITPNARVEVREVLSGAVIENIATIEPLGVPQAIVGCFDGIAGAVATGWAYNPANPSEATVVDFFANGALVL